MKIRIPIKPITINKAWRGRRFKTSLYEQYEYDAIFLIKNEHKPIIKGWIEVRYDFYVKRYTTSDVGNFEKPLSDIITKAGLIEDDKFIKKMVLEKHKSDEEYIEITIKPYETNESL